MRTLACLALIGALLGARAVAASPVTPGRCPSTGPVHVGVNGWSATRAKLAPPGASSVRLCRYASLTLHRRLLRTRLVAARRLVGALVREFDQLPPFPPGPVACPNDNGAQIAALLAYPGGRRVTISLETSGCAPATNGNLNRTAAPLRGPRQVGPRLLAQLERLTT